MLFFLHVLFLVTCFSSSVFASKSVSLSATAAQPAAQCTLKAHAAVYAEQKKIAAAIARINEPNGPVRLLPPLIQIVASYCAGPMYWKMKRELNLPPDGCLRYVNSIAEISADKIAVSYAPSEEQPVGKHTVKISYKATIWNLGQDNPVPDCQTLDKFSTSVFTSISEDIIEEGKHRFGATILVNTRDGSAQEINIGHENVIYSLISFPGALCAIGTHRGTVLIVDKSDKGDIVVRSLKSIAADQPDEPAIVALCSLPNNRLAMGDIEGNMGVVHCSDGLWDAPLRTSQKDYSKDFCVDAIVGWPDGIIAAVLSRQYIDSYYERHIECWDTESNKHLGTLLAPGRIINGVCALPNRQLVVYFSENDKLTPNVLGIYKISTDVQNGTCSLEIEQKLSFKSDPISQRGISLGQHIPFYLSKSKVLTLAIGTESGAVQIWQEDVCPDCELVKK